MTRAILSACLTPFLLLSAGCSGSFEGSWEADLPRRKSARSSVREPIRIAQQAAAVEQAKLEKQLAELEAWETAKAQPLPERLSRWTAFHLAAKNSSYAPISRARLAALDRRVRLACRAAITAGTHSCISNKWDAGLAQIEKHIAKYPRHASSDDARKRLAQLRAYREARSKAWTVRVGFGKGKNGWMPSSGGIRLAGAQKIGPRKKNWRELVFGVPGQSLARYQFQVPGNVRKATLMLSHHVARAGVRFAPISVIVNGRIITSRFNADGVMLFGRNVWDISHALKPGQPNDVVIKLEQDALTVYWLLGLEISSTTPALFMPVR